MNPSLILTLASGLLLLLTGLTSGRPNLNEVGPSRDDTESVVPPEA